MSKEPLSEADVAALVSRFPLPADVPDAVVNRAQLASAFSVSVNTIDKWIDAGMPVLAEGTNGQSYQFQLSACWAWRQADLAAQRVRSDEAESAVSAMRLALVGGQSGDGLDALPPREKREIYTTQLAYEELARARNQLLQRSEVRDLLDDLFSLTRDGVSSLPDKLERSVGLNNRQVEAASHVCDELLSELKGAIERFFAGRPERGVTGESKTLFDA